MSNSNEFATGSIGDEPSPVWEAAQQRKPRGGRGSTRGRRPADIRLDHDIAELQRRHRHVVCEQSETTKLRMMGRAAAIWAPKDALGQPARFVEVGLTKLLYVEPVYAVGQRGFITRVDLLQLSARLDAQSQTVTYSAGRRGWELWREPQGRNKDGHDTLAMDLMQRDQMALCETALNLFEDLAYSCARQPADRHLPAVAETSDDRPAKAINQRRVLPRLVVGSYERPTFDPNNVAPVWADDLGAAEEFFETVIVEPMLNTNMLELFFVPLGFYAKWPAIETAYGPKYTMLYEDFGKVLEVVKTRDDQEVLRIAPLILWSEVTRDAADYRLSIEGVSTQLDLRPRAYASEAAAEVDSDAESTIAESANDEAEFVPQNS